MITKYLLTTEHTGVLTNRISRRTRLISHKETLQSEINCFFAPFKYMKDGEKYKNGINNLITKIQSSDDLKVHRMNNFNFEKEYDYYKASLKVKCKEVQYETSRENNSFVETFYTSLRKCCESSAAWGLWQWIHYVADKKEYYSLIDSFWKMMIAATHQANEQLIKSKKYSYEDRKGLKVISNYIYDTFKENMDAYFVHTKNKPLDEGDIRRQYFMMIGLLEGVNNSRNDDFCSVIHDVFYYKALKK